MIEMINAANPDVLWVGLGSPKQDYWMARHRDRLNVPVMIGVGRPSTCTPGAFRRPRAGCSAAGWWLFRLAAEPGRLWRRYLIYNPLFMLYMALQLPAAPPAAND